VDVVVVGDVVGDGDDPRSAFFRARADMAHLQPADARALRRRKGPLPRSRGRVGVGGERPGPGERPFCVARPRSQTGVVDGVGRFLQTRVRQTLTRASGDNESANRPRMSVPGPLHAATLHVYSVSPLGQRAEGEGDGAGSGQPRAQRADASGPVRRGCGRACPKTFEKFEPSPRASCTLTRLPRARGPRARVVQQMRARELQPRTTLCLRAVHPIDQLDS
jgi:hypothetical protein